MPYRLPPLNALRLFEAAGRHLSFKLAAEELHLTPSAVSHGIKSLEDWLGTALFARDHRGLSLTEAGAAYLPRVREALALIATATEAVPGRRPGGHLSLSVAPGFGVRWLIPNLPRFRARHPDIDVVLDTEHRHVAFPRDGVDMAIRMGRGDWADVHATRLIVEALVPVCAPGLAKEIATPADLAAHTLLHVTSVSEDWDVWTRLAGIDGLDVSRGPRFDSVDMALEAAAEGLGVAIGRLPLAAADLESGRLTAVLGPPRQGATGYWLMCARESLDRPEVAAFRDWIRAELDGSAPPAGAQAPT